MQFFHNMFVALLVAASVVGSNYALASTQDAAEPRQGALSSKKIEALIETLEDTDQRGKLIESLRTLVQVNSEQNARPASERMSVKSAAAELLDRLANRVSEVAASAATVFKNVQNLPAAAQQWIDALGEPETRARWVKIAGRLTLVLGSGFAAAILVGWVIRRLVPRADEIRRRGLAARILRLSGHLLLDLIPVVMFAAASYAVLALIDSRHETRLVAVALINASILSRLVLAAASFLFAPDMPHLRLWRIGDESAHYLHHWVRRLSFIFIYGFFALQAALLLGLNADAYQLLLRLLGAVLIGLLLVLIAQNREDVARAIAAERRADSDEPAQLSPVRNGLAQVWHLLAGLYLVLVYTIWLVQVEDAAQFVMRATLISVAALASVILLSRATNHVFERGLVLSTDLRSRFPGLEQRLNRYFPVLRKLLKLVIITFAVLLVASAWGADALSWVTEGTGRVLLGAAVNIVLIVLLAAFLWELASGAIERYLTAADEQGNTVTRSPRIRTLLTVGRNALLVVLALVSTLMVLSELGINIAPLLAGAGVVGLAIGFGAQRLVQDVINGVFILFQDLMAVGDVVKLGDKAGVVEALSIRTVRLRDLAGVVHTIPFSAIEGVSNLTREFSFHVFDLGIAYRENVDSVIELLKQIGEELRADAEIGPLILEPLEVFGLDAFGDSAIVIKGRIKTRPIKQWQVGRAFNRLVKLRFDQHGIEIPFPHRTLYFGQDKDGAAPPAFVQLESMLRDSPVAEPRSG